LLPRNNPDKEGWNYGDLDGNLRFLRKAMRGTHALAGVKISEF
jgi:hypothetical protein